MNLITNRCLGAYIYRDILKTQYENPFIWTSIWDESFNILFEDFDKINFDNFKVLHDTAHTVEKYYVLIDDAVRVNYGHVILDNDATTPSTRDVNIYTNDPIKYIGEKYTERLRRMINPPVFIYLDLDFTQNYAISTIARRKQRALGILTVDQNFPSNEFVNKQLVVHQDWKKQSWWEYLYESHLNEINNLL